MVTFLPESDSIEHIIKIVHSLPTCSLLESLRISCQKRLITGTQIYVTDSTKQIRFN